MTTLSGCSNQLCNKVGCSDGVLVELSRTVPDSFAAPPQGTIRVGWATAVVETTLAFEYRASRPNGRDCPPVCNQASVAMDLPSVANSPLQPTEPPG
jgi:hypothetical protein